MDHEVEPQTPAQVVRIATILWAALTATPLLAAVGVLAMRDSGGEGGAALPPLFAGVAVGVAVVSAIAMFVVPPLVAPVRAGVRPAAVLMLRTIIAGAIGEAGALLSAVAFLLTGVTWALAGVALFVAASLVRRPTLEAFDAIEREQRRAM